MHRTGCYGCPYALEKYRKKELEVIKKTEPNMYTAVMNIFGPAYDYNTKYRNFVKQKKKQKETYHQITLDELML